MNNKSNSDSKVSRLRNKLKSPNEGGKVLPDRRRKVKKCLSYLEVVLALNSYSGNKFYTVCTVPKNKLDGS